MPVVSWLPERLTRRYRRAFTSTVRRLFMVCAVVLISGCGGREKVIDPTGTGRSPTQALRPAPSKPAPLSAKPTGPIIVASDAPLGRVVLVNANLRFVVIDFGLRGLPEPGARLSVFRKGLKMGEVKITGWREETNTVGDIVAGEAAKGDEIRAD